MKFSISKKQFVQPLTLASDLAKKGGRNGNYAYRNIAIKIGDDSKLLVLGSNGRVEIGGNLLLNDAPQGQAGGFCVSPKLYDLCRTLDEDAELTLETEDGVVVVATANGKYRLNSLPEDQFATLDIGPKALTIEVSASILLRMLTQVSYVIPQNEVRYYLNGLLIEARKDTLRTVATDGHRLAMCTRTIKGCAPKQTDPFKALIPESAVESMAKMLHEQVQSDHKAIARLEMDDTSLELIMAADRIGCTLIDGNFPDYERVIPQNSDKEIIVSVKEFRAALSRAAIIAADSTNTSSVLLEPAAGGSEKMRITAENADKETAEETVSAKFTASSKESVKVRYNVSYLEQMLSRVTSENISIKFSDPNEAAVLNAIEDNNDTQYILMPIRI